MKADFFCLGNGGHYTSSQKEYAFQTIQEYRIRAMSRILSVPHRTLQRWCRQCGADNMVYMSNDVRPGFLSEQKNCGKGGNFKDAGDIFK
jgi:hypothetical protein